MIRTSWTSGKESFIKIRVRVNFHSVRTLWARVLETQRSLTTRNTVWIRLSGFCESVAKFNIYFQGAFDFFIQIKIYSMIHTLVEILSCSELRSQETISQKAFRFDTREKTNDSNYYERSQEFKQSGSKIRLKVIHASCASLDTIVWRRVSFLDEYHEKSLVSSVKICFVWL